MWSSECPLAQLTGTPASKPLQCYPWCSGAKLVPFQGNAGSQKSRPARSLKGCLRSQSGNAKQQFAAAPCRPSLGYPRAQGEFPESPLRNAGGSAGPPAALGLLPLPSGASPKPSCCPRFPPLGLRGTQVYPVKQKGAADILPASSREKQTAPPSRELALLLQARRPHPVRCRLALPRPNSVTPLAPPSQRDPAQPGAAQWQSSAEWSLSVPGRRPPSPAPPAGTESWTPLTKPVGCSPWAAAA